MKKILLNVALIASMAVSAYAQGDAPEMSITTDWGYVVENGKANPVPDFEGGWGGNTTPQNKYCTRFGVGKDGKFLVQNHSNNTISAVTKDGVSVYKQLNPITPGVKWNGTAISTDDAGNVIFNYCFTAGFGSAETAQGKSVKYWGVIDKNKNITDVNVSDADYNALGITEKGRLDIISHIVGDVTSAEGGIGYACLQGFDKVVMFHFKGDGSKVTSVTVKACSRKIEALPKSGVNGDTQLIMASPKYTKLDQILAEENPEDQFVLPLGVLNPNGADNGAVPPVIAGIVATFNDGDFEQLMGYGNRGYLLSSVFELQGKKYMVRNYMDQQSDLYKNNTYKEGDTDVYVYSTWGNVMTYGVFDMTTGQCVASWMGSGYRNGFGMGYINVEPIDANSVHIYTYASVGGEYNTDIKNEPSGTKNGIYCAVTTFKVKGEDPVPPTPGEIAGSGTETDPYLIATKEDLCNAYTKVAPNKVVYFKQTADIDMAGVTEYHALNGSAGGFPVAEGSDSYAYNSGFVYDGANHIIYNFQPVDRDAIKGGDNSYYCSSIFGVIEGTIMNLGVVNAKINVTYSNQGGGILGAY
ncbi:MAG: hypothetical protein K2J74_03395, partial [Muribaculaceae bacterium]|nr:hypothetical protein [Muribaculaceae bacterium]